MYYAGEGIDPSYIHELYEQAKQAAIREGMIYRPPEIMGEIKHIPTMREKAHEAAARIEQILKDNLPVVCLVTVSLYELGRTNSWVDSLELVVQYTGPDESYMELSPLRIRELEASLEENACDIQ